MVNMYQTEAKKKPTLDDLATSLDPGMSVQPTSEEAARKAAQDAYLKEHLFDSSAHDEALSQANEEADAAIGGWQNRLGRGLSVFGAGLAGQDMGAAMRTRNDMDQQLREKLLAPIKSKKDDEKLQANLRNELLKQFDSNENARRSRESETDQFNKMYGLKERELALKDRELRTKLLSENAANKAKSTEAKEKDLGVINDALGAIDFLYDDATSRKKAADGEIGFSTLFGGKKDSKAWAQNVTLANSAIAKSIFGKGDTAELTAARKAGYLIDPGDSYDTVQKKLNSIKAIIRGKQAQLSGVRKLRDPNGNEVLVSFAD